MAFALGVLFSFAFGELSSPSASYLRFASGLRLRRVVFAFGEFSSLRESLRFASFLRERLVGKVLVKSSGGTKRAEGASRLVSIAKLFCIETSLFMARAMRHINCSIDMDDAWALASVLFLDVETTGLDPRRGARISELALLSKTRTVFSGPIEETSIDQLNHLFRANVLVGHNIKFDLLHLSSHFERNGRRFPIVHILDTLGLFESPRRLSVIGAENGWDGEWHTAEWDAEVCRKIAEKFINPLSTLAAVGVTRVSMMQREVFHGA